jgi:hypothetical protein
MHIHIKFYLVFFSSMFCNVALMAQNPKINSFQRVKIPDSIYLQLEKAYKANTGYSNVNAGKNVWNLTNSQDLIFKNGLYSCKGQGPHFPRRLFFYNNGILFFFKNNNINTVISEYSECIKLFDLSETDQIKYLKFLCVYLEQEINESYGAEIKIQK